MRNLLLLGAMIIAVVIIGRSCTKDEVTNLEPTQAVAAAPDLPKETQSYTSYDGFKLSFDNSFDQGLTVYNVSQEYDKWKGLYKLSFTMANNGTKNYSIIQVNGVFYKNGKRVGDALTGWEFKKGDAVDLYLNTIIPEGAPDVIALSIDKEMSE